MKELYQLGFKVTSFDVGRGRTLKYSMILKLLQEAAGRQLEDGGMSYEALREQGGVFLLTKVVVRIFRMPAVGENLIAETWFRGLKGAQFIRDMRLKTEQGETLADSESSWVVTDPETHRIIRPSGFPYPEVMRPANIESLEVKAENRPVELSPLGERTVRWSDIDCNGHMNNAVYADILCDFFPGGLGEQAIEVFTISFHREVLEGETIELFGGDDSGFVSLEGRCRGQKCFSAAAEQLK